jgi:hypothetical protein
MKLVTVVGLLLATTVKSLNGKRLRWFGLSRIPDGTGASVDQGRLGLA